MADSRWEYVPGRRWEDEDGNERWFTQAGIIAPSYVDEYVKEGGRVLRRKVGPWEVYSG